MGMAAFDASQVRQTDDVLRNPERLVHHAIDQLVLGFRTT